MTLTTRRLAFAALLSCAASLSQADIIHFGAALSPEVPGATGSGSVLVTWDTVDNTFQIDSDWSGLSGTTTVAHIHCCTAAPGTGTIGVAVTPGTLPGFPLGLSTGSYSSPPIDLDLASSFNAAFVSNFAGGNLANADNALIAGINAGRAYFNVHSTTFPGGEIRGFLQQVPEPATLSLLAIALAGLGFRARREK